MNNIDNLLKKEGLFPEEIELLSKNLPNNKLVKEQIDLIWIHLTKIDGGSYDISGILLSLKKWYGDSNFIIELQKLWPTIDFETKTNMVSGVKYTEFLSDKDLMAILNLIIKYDKDKELFIILFVFLSALNKSKKNRNVELCSLLVLSIKSEINKFKYIFLRKKEFKLVDRMYNSIKIFYEV